MTQNRLPLFSLTALLFIPALLCAAPVFNLLDPWSITTRQVEPEHNYQGVGKRLAAGSASITGTIYTTPPSSGYVTVIDTFGYEVADIYVSNYSGGSGASYSVPSLQAGSYLLYFDANPYNAKSKRTYLGNTTAFANGRWLSVASGQTLSGQDISASVATVTMDKVIISGSVILDSTVVTYENLNFSFVQADAKPLLIPSSNSFSSPIQTDGTFACTTSIVPGNYYAKIAMSSYGSRRDPVAQWWDGSSITTEPVPVQIFARETNKTIRFAKGAVIYAPLKDSALSTFGSIFYIYAINENGYIFATDYLSSSTAIRDTARLTGLPAGKYRIKITSINSATYGTGSYPDMYYGPSTSPATATEITVNSGDSIMLAEMVLSKKSPLFYVSKDSATITGTIISQETGSPVSMARVYATSLSTGSSANVTTSTTGAYTLRVPVGNDYQVSSTAPTNEGTDYYACRTFYPGVLSATDATPISLGKNETKQLNITLQTGGSIGGFVRNQAGLPLWDADLYSSMSFPFGSTMMLVGFAYSKTQLYTGFFSLNGGIRLIGIPEGTYSLRTIKYPDIFLSNPDTSLPGGYVVASNLRVVRNATTVTPVLTMRATHGSISGTMATSKPYEGFYCYDTDSVLCGFGFSYGISAAATGNKWSLFYTQESVNPYSSATVSFSIKNLPAGTYAIAHASSQSSQSVLDWYGSGQTTISPYSDNSFSILKPAIPAGAQWITIGENQAVSGINFNNVNVISQRQPQKPSVTFSLYRKSGARTISLSYSIVSKAGNAHLDINDLKGRLISRRVLDNASGTIVIGTSGQKPLTSGTYIFTVACGDISRTILKNIVW